VHSAETGVEAFDLFGVAVLRWTSLRGSVRVEVGVKSRFTRAGVL
jgi:hypothetical protein